MSIPVRQCGMKRGGDSFYPFREKAKRDHDYKAGAALALTERRAKFALRDMIMSRAGVLRLGNGLLF